MIKKQGWHDKIAKTYVIHILPISQEEFLKTGITKKGYKTIVMILLIAGAILFTLLLPFLILIPLERIPFYYKLTSPSKTSTIANWNVYTNTKYNYSIKHPSNFSVLSTIPDIYLDPSTSPSIQIGPIGSPIAITIESDREKNESQNLIEFITKRTIYPVKIINETVIDGRQAIFVSYNDNLKNLRLDAYIAIDNTHVMFMHHSPVFQGAEEEYKNFFYQIVSTLRFID